MRYGDEDGDYLNEINYTVGPPLIKVISDGTHIGRGGLAKIEANYIFAPIFMMPDAALRVHSNLDGNGVSGSILGEGAAGSSCADVADIMYDVAGGVIEYGGDLGATPRIEESSRFNRFCAPCSASDALARPASAIGCLPDGDEFGRRRAGGILVRRLHRRKLK